VRIASPRRFARLLIIVASLGTLAAFGLYTPKAVPEAAPTRLAIPALGIDAAVAAYTEAEAAASVDGATGAPCLIDGVIRCVNPASANEIAWQKAGVGGIELGATPGSQATGTVYLYGHAAEGGTAVFDNLNALEVGDKAVLTTETGRLKFEVTQVLSVAKADFVWLPDVVSQIPGRLLLISCDHTASSEFVNGGYSTRNVVVVLELKSWRYQEST